MLVQRRFEKELKAYPFWDNLELDPRREPVLVPAGRAYLFIVPSAIINRINQLMLSTYLSID